MSDRFDHLFISPGDFARSLAFYRDVMGWEVVRTWEEPNGKRGAILSSGSMKLVMSESSAIRDDSGSARPQLHLDIHDLDSRYLALPKGAHVVVEPTETHWGTRWFVVRDPDGNLIAFEELHSREE